MAGLIRRGDIDELRHRVNLGEVVADYVSLKSAGSGSMKGLCPFHDERSPSFHVRPQAGFFHCFGCGEGGDVFSFLQKIDHLSFYEAVERLADRVGFTLTYEEGKTAPPKGNRNRLFEIHQVAEIFFREQLLTKEAEAGRKFLGDRGFDSVAAERFGLGYAPASYEALSKYLASAGFNSEELLESGMVSRGDRGLYDRFRGRLVWPIRDVTGQTIAFGARQLSIGDSGPKYLNSPETPIYQKSRVLYGLDLAKRAVAKLRQVVIVEGYTDVMACHQAGIETAIATCGTAFGSNHVSLVRRVLGDSENPSESARGEVIFTFDPDEAGKRAASRAFVEESRFVAQTFVAVPPEGLDPCDLRISKGDEALRNVISQRRPMYEFMIKQTFGERDLETVEGRTQALRSAAPIVAGIRDRAIRDGYARELAGWLGMNPDDVSRELRGQKDSAPALPLGKNDPKPEGEPYGLSVLSNDPATTLERDALMVLLQHPDIVSRDRADAVLQSRFSHRALALLRDSMLGVFDSYGKANWVSLVTEGTPEKLRTLVGQLAVAPLPEQEDQVDRYCSGITASILDRELAREKSELLGTLQRSDSEKDPSFYRATQEKLLSIEISRRELRED